MPKRDDRGLIFPEQDGGKPDRLRETAQQNCKSKPKTAQGFTLSKCTHPATQRTGRSQAQGGLKPDEGMPRYFMYTTISTRRFLALPEALEFGATGRAEPQPQARTRLLGIPFFTR